MGVDIEEHLRSTVAQAILGVFDANAVCREAAGVIVPEFVEGDDDGPLDADAVGGKCMYNNYKMN